MNRIVTRLPSQPRRWSSLVALAVVLLVWLVTMATPPSASAHAALLRSDPAAGASLAASPDAITLWLSETVELRYSTVTVMRSDGSAVQTGALTSVGTPAEPAVRVDLRDSLPRGSYTVVYSVLSSVDGHLSGGFFSFTVGDALLPSAEQQSALASRAAASTIVPLPVSSTIRWLNLLGQGILAGLLVFLVVVLSPVAREAGAGGVPARRFRRLVAGAVTALVVGHLAAAVIQSMNAGRSTSPTVVIDILPSILSETRFGALWLARGTLLVAWALVGWALLRGSRLPAFRGRGRLLWSAGLLVSALVLLTTSLGSHAATRGGATSRPVLTDWLHLIVTSIWMGGLAGLLLAFDIVPAGVPRKDLIARFSRLALFSVAGIVVTGAVSAWVEAYSWDGLVSTDYGTWLIVKLVLVAGALGFGAHHLLNIRPRFEPDGAEDRRRASVSFRCSLRLEALLVAGAVVATGVLTSTPPARDLLKGVEVLASTRLVSSASVTIRIAPPRVGVNDFSVVVAPSDPEAFGDIQRVYLRFTPLAVDAPAGTAGLVGSQRIQLRQSGPADASTFLGNGSFITLDGDWNVTVVVRRAGVADDLEAPFGVTARDGKLSLTGVPEDTAKRNGAAIGLGLVWLLAAAVLLYGSWRMRSYRLALSYGLIGLALVSFAMGSLLVIVGGGILAI